MNLVIFGPPGAGKGTQAVFLCDRFGLAHLSTGDMLRAERRAGTPLGREAEQIINNGKFVPDSMVRELVRIEAEQRLAEGKSLLIDGYPRNLVQLNDLEAILGELGASIDLALSLEVDPESVVHRLSARRTCPNPDCAQVYNLFTRPPAKAGICDKCGSELYQRGDDRPEAISQRLEVYRRQTKPMLDHLLEEGKLRTVAADRPIEEVRDSLARLIAEWDRDGAAAR